jgi:hypothetical protein
MSDTTPENESGTAEDTSDKGAISDEQLPDDLRPDKNPLAQAPDADGEEGEGGPAVPGGAPGAGGAPDPGAAGAGQPG